MQRVTPAWQGAWIRALEAAGAHPALALAPSPVYPLARTVPLPAGGPYPTGALGFALADLEVTGLGGISAVAAGTDRVRVRLTGVSLRGRYRLETKPDPVPELDTAGNLMERRTQGPALALAGADAGPGEPGPEAEQWLDNARTQRARLGETDNGLKLIALYNEHNETYEEVFRTSPTLPTNWRAGGVTAAMAGDTSTAIEADGVVNSSSKDYGGGVTYNGNAFVQQLNVAVETLTSDPNFDIFKPVEQQNLSGRYWDAAKAALSFGKGVNTTTGNAKDQVTEMKPTQVYATVDAQAADLPPVSDAEAKSVFGSALGSTSGGADAVPGPGWIVIDEEDRARVRSIVAARARLRAGSADVPGDVLHAGPVTAELGTIDVDVTLAAGGPPAAVAVDLPPFALDIDDAAWTGEVADVARARLSSMFCYLLHESLVSGLAQLLGPVVARAHAEVTGAA